MSEKINERLKYLYNHSSLRFQWKVPFEQLSEPQIRTLEKIATNHDKVSDKYDSKSDTFEHIGRVRQLLRECAGGLQQRALIHDKSKLDSPEKELFDEYTPKLKNCTYGSDEYKEYLKGLKVALDHHYANNSHHPEFYGYNECNGCFKRFKHKNGNEPEIPKNGCCDVCGYGQFTFRPNINGFDLFDLIEMFMDWKAATERHNDGDIRKSIEINKDRFELSDQVCDIFRNTADRMNW